MIPGVILVTAIALDLLLGDPPNALHPVAWIGRLVSVLERLAPRRSPIGQLVYGAAMVAFALGLVAIICYLLLISLAARNQVTYVLVSALVLKCTFSIRELVLAAQRVKLALLKDDLPRARYQLRALVSRDTTNLDAPHLASAAVESVAENAVDSFISPVFMFLLFASVPPFGVVAALVYRAANTFDSMVGYHGRYEYLGKAAARLDDTLNWLPARLGALFLVLCAFFFADGRCAWRVMWRDHGGTESPNAGWPMSAVAGALHVSLVKAGHYRLGDGDLPDSAAIDRSCRLTVSSLLLFAAIGGIILSLALW